MSPLSVIGGRGGDVPWSPASVAVRPQDRTEAERETPPKPKGAPPAPPRLPQPVRHGRRA